MSFKQFNESVNYIDLMNIKSEIDTDLLTDLINDDKDFQLRFGKNSVAYVLMRAREEAQRLTNKAFMRCKVLIFDFKDSLFFQFFVPVGSTEQIFMRAKYDPPTRDFKLLYTSEKAIAQARAQPHIDLNKVIGSKFDTGSK